jgi:hypothetical protein
MYVIPRYGLFAAAAVVSIAMIVSRGLYVPYWVSRYVGLGYLEYLRGIFVRPVLLMAPGAALSWGLDRAAGAPATWPMVLGGGLLLCVLYYPLAFWFGLEPEHRTTILHTASAPLRAWNRTDPAAVGPD